jgi:hypothetical protein
MTRLILTASVAIALAHFLLIAQLYASLPPTIPAFVSLDGKVLVSLATTPLTACRLPLMGLVTQIACWSMARQANPRLWSAVSLLAGAKLLLSSLDLVLPNGQARLAVIAVSLIAILALLPALKTPPIRKVNIPILIVCLVTYLALVAMPWWPL